MLMALSSVLFCIPSDDCKLVWIITARIQWVCLSAHDVIVAVYSFFPSLIQFSFFLYFFSARTHRVCNIGLVWTNAVNEWAITNAGSWHLWCYGMYIPIKLYTMQTNCMYICVMHIYRPSYACHDRLDRFSQRMEKQTNGKILNAMDSDWKKCGGGISTSA